MKDYYDPCFYGTETYWKMPYFGEFAYTDSVKSFCTKYEAYWTLDVIASYYKEFKKYSFLVITFDVANSSCIFNAREDTGKKPVRTQNIEYTDLTVSIKLYLTNNVLMFPSDY